MRTRHPVSSLAAVLACALAGALIAPPAAAEEPSDGQKLALRTKPGVVRVVAGYLVDLSLDKGTERQFFGGHGSGFFVDPDGYIATNAHVVEFVHLDEDKARERIIEQILVAAAQQTGTDLRTVPKRDLAQLIDDIQRRIRIAKKVTVVVLPNGDKLSYDIKAYGTPVGVDGAKDVAILKVQTKNAPTLIIGDEASVQIQDKILAIGYPGAADDLVGVLDEEAILEATITDGAVSAKKKSSDGVPVIQVTTIISPGNSGGPAVNEKGDVIGLATFGHAQRQGYNFIVPASTVKEFVRQAGADNKDSATNLVYAEALALHWSGRYTKAIAKFEEVKQLFPSHSEVDKLITEARELKLAGKETSESSGGGAAIAVVIVAAIAVLGAGGFLLVRARTRTGPGQMAHPGAWQQGPHPGHQMPGHPMQQMPGQYGFPPQGQRPHGTPGPGYAPGSHPNMPATGGAMPPSGAVPAGQGHGPGAGGHGGPGAHGGVEPGFAKTIGVANPGGARTIAVSPSGGAQLASLSISRGPLQGQQFPLGPHGITIGRSPAGAQIVVSDGRVSGKHVWIGFQDGVLVAIDQGSTNGTYVNDMQRGRITRVELRHGDSVIVSEPDVCTLTVVNPSA